MFACCCLSKPTSAKKKRKKETLKMTYPVESLQFPYVLISKTPCSPPLLSSPVLPNRTLPPILYSECHSQCSVPASARAQVPIRLTAMESATLGSECPRQPSVIPPRHPLPPNVLMSALSKYVPWMDVSHTQKSFCFWLLSVR